MFLTLPNCAGNFKPRRENHQSAKVQLATTSSTRQSEQTPESLSFARPQHARARPWRDKSEQAARKLREP